MHDAVAIPATPHRAHSTHSGRAEADSGYLCVTRRCGRRFATVIEFQVPVMNRKIPIGILGATGVVGQRFIQMLEHHPWFEVAWLAASDRSEGKAYAEAARWRLKTQIPANVAKMQVSPATPEGAPKDHFRRSGCFHCSRTRASICRRRLRRGFQLQRTAHAGRRAARDS